MYVLHEKISHNLKKKIVLKILNIQIGYLTSPTFEILFSKILISIFLSMDKFIKLPMHNSVEWSKWNSIKQSIEQPKLNTVL